LCASAGHTRVCLRFERRITAQKGETMKFKAACGGTIVVPPKVEQHLWAHPEVRDLLPLAIGRMKLPLDGSFISTEVEMGHVVGRSGCVATPPIGLDDQRFFALRVGREKPSRVILDVEGPETTKVVVMAFPSRESRGVYILVTSFVGQLAPKEPWDKNIRSQSELQESLDFWCSHALIYDPEISGPVFESTWRQVLE
jgi:hypothetical protein